MNKKKNRSCFSTFFWLGIVVVLVICLGTALLVIVGGGFSAPTPVLTYHDMAIIKCQEFGKNKLLNPSTAFFPAVSDPNVQAAPSRNHSNTYDVSSWIDSKNGYGEWVRNYYDCTVEYDNDGKWHLRQFDFGLLVRP